MDLSDLVTVASYFGERTVAAAPPRDRQIHASSITPHPSRDTQYDTPSIHQAIRALEAMPDPSRGALIARDFLRTWLSQAEPVLAETKFHPNYPNPFNPETWIPYQLAEPANVTIALYDVQGGHIRTLNLGFRPTGFYLDSAKAAYWNGRNAAGETVASGVYFYRMVAGDYTALYQMQIKMNRFKSPSVPL